MQIKQEISNFESIHIVLDERWEAKALFDLIDKLDNYINMEDAELPYNSFTRDQKDLIIKLSNARTNKDVEV